MNGIRRGVVIWTGTIVSIACEAGAPPITTGLAVDTLGDLQVAIVVTGPTSDPDGYVVIVHLDEVGDLDPHIVESGGGVTVFADLVPGTPSVRVESLEDTCAIWGAAAHAVDVRAGRTSITWFVVDCAVSNMRQVFDRVALDAAEWAERYVLNPDSTFRYQAKSDTHGLLELSGTYSSNDLETTFTFERAGYKAVGTSWSDCLSIHYNVDMSLDGYEDGQFCLAPDP